MPKRIHDNRKQDKNKQKILNLGDFKNRGEMKLKIKIGDKKYDSKLIADHEGWSENH